MRTTDPTKNSVVLAPRGGFTRRFATAYRWIASVLARCFLRRGGTTPSNHVGDLNAHQLRDIGLDHWEISSRQEQERHARLAAYAFLIGMHGR
ncbi:hypothetical protein [Agrobacterium vitis]|uniref:Uncharacterized protein n=1 Tax=Agrobacterium vitis TaxID=373 RepID=A0A109D0Z0_AGRVI|nr:hypothetical protein [Agrobacterium vitis]KAA3519580.1 hypothetical protein DXM22_01370 [Agrobacterium vitis]KAA3532209.1 hypothetical protein DXT89_02350 [Agrobacterium vitis]MCE6074539.1 hypothetical protein [Agrobacterium vitis]MCF1475717.1 hypothetical protein [Agrobacterium vitis]MCM2449832.1 hypothetical protein [Agrobacterium vitis]